MSLVVRQVPVGHGIWVQAVVNPVETRTLELIADGQHYQIKFTPENVQVTTSPEKKGTTE